MARLTSAQLKFLDRCVPAQLNWLKVGVHIGSRPEIGQRRTFNALVRRDVIDAGGQITLYGLAAYNRAIDRVKRKSSESQE